MMRVNRLKLAQRGRDKKTPIMGLLDRENRQVHATASNFLTRSGAHRQIHADNSTDLIWHEHRKRADGKALATGKTDATMSVRKAQSGIC
jgi:hypothetical protein